MTKYQYDVIDVKESEVETVLNEYGSIGWKLVNFHVTTYVKQNPKYTLVMMRRHDEL